VTSSQSHAVLEFFEGQSYLERNPLIPIRASIVSALLSGLRGGRVLDLGCGDGSISRPLLASGNELTLVDFSPRMLDSARAATPPGAPVEFVEGDIMSFTAPRHYDAVICVGVLAHVPSVPEAVATVKRALRPGGFAVMQITDDDSALGRLLNLYYNMRKSGDYRLNRTTRRQLLDESTKNGLLPITLRRYGALLPGLGHLPRGWEERIEWSFASRPRLSRLAAELIILSEHRG
jgi:2-polyprenyl-3-methyl-5-hydroxy-6-metoxy-1,4-benzoquinol methylase